MGLETKRDDDRSPPAPWRARHASDRLYPKGEDKVPRRVYSPIDLPMISFMISFVPPYMRVTRASA